MDKEFWQAVLNNISTSGFWGGIGGGLVVMLLSVLAKSWFERKNYVSKVRFDAEFAIYRELFATMSIAVNDVGILFPERSLICYFSDDEKRKNANRSYAEFAKALAKNSAFVPKNIFERFETIRKKCFVQLNWFDYPYLFHLPIPQDQEEKCHRLTSEIYDEQESLRDDLREYLEKLDVL